jgi:hypothetical protein
VSIVEPNPEPRIGQQFRDGAFEFDQIFFWQ